jgi:hypothetical protein
MCSHESRPSSLPRASGNISHGVFRSMHGSPVATVRGSMSSASIPACASSSTRFGVNGAPLASTSGLPPLRARTVVCSPAVSSQVIFQNPAPQVSRYQSAELSLRRAWLARQ